MREVNESELINITGGSDLSAPIINAIVNVIKVLYDAGTGLGSAIRRIHDDSLCPTR